MADRLIRPGDEGVTVTASALRTLLSSGNGDAALLYLALLRRHGGVTPRSLAGELRWDRERIELAETALQEMKLLAPEPEAEPPLPAERPAYSGTDVAEKLETSGEFRSLLAAVEQRMGKKLATPDVASLLGLCDYLGLPANVVYQLVCHCMERAEHRPGGRRPGMRQIEREGYAWSRLGIDSQEAVDAYLRKYAQRQGAFPGYMKALNLPERLPAPSEEKYLAAWQDMGFPPETVAIAYDKTVLRCGEFRWAYCNGILKKWHQAGLHSPAQVETGDRPAKPREQTPPPPERRQEDLTKLRQYIRRRDREE